MASHLDRRGPLGWIPSKALLQEVSCGWRQSLGEYDRIVTDNETEDFQRVFTEYIGPWRFTSEHLHHCAADRPDIRREAAACFADNLGGHVNWSALHRELSGCA